MDQEQDHVAFARSRKFDRELEAIEKLIREREVAAAEKSAKWALGSMVVSVCALALSAWPYLRAWMG